MSKAKELAEIKYPIHSVLIVPARGGGYYADKHLREGFIAGYHRAEKDLELTWKDLKLLQDISHEVFAEVANGSVDYYQIYPTEQSFLKEVLKRFNERKK